jgi:cyclopropane fatty-acyl-phospholipid synthase-like methyltransferase
VLSFALKSCRNQELGLSSKRTNSEAAAAYYDNPDIARFYRICWGGSDVHVGLYKTGNETIAEASAAMTRHLLSLSQVGPGDRVLDIGCGYGGTLRILAGLGCRPSGIDFSERCVEEAIRLNKEAGFEDSINVEFGDFHKINSCSGIWDAVFCQESLIHSTDKLKVFSEVYRVLRPGGVFAFSDILTGENADIPMVEAAFARLGVEAGVTGQHYRDMAREVGFEVERFEERLEDIKTHYAKLAEMLTRPIEGLDPKVVVEISQSISLWEAALAKGHITWACFIARKLSA